MIQQGLLLMLVVLPVLLILRLPHIVPIHFNLHGEADGYGSRWVLLVIPGIGLFIYSLLKCTLKLKKYVNYPVKITPENRSRQDSLVEGLIQQYIFTTLIIFVILSLLAMRSAESSHFQGTGWIVSLIFPVYLLPLFLYIRKASKIK